MNYYQKYTKYKNKYINLKNKISKIYNKKNIISIDNYLSDKPSSVFNFKYNVYIYNLFSLLKKDDEMFKKELKMDVTFPYTVSIEDVNKLIKKESEENVSLSMLYL